MKEEHRVTVRFPAELRKKLAVAARRTGIKESELIREAVERQLAAEDHKLTAYDYSKVAGLIGVIEGESPDLSTNPSYLDGFGAN